MESMCGAKCDECEKYKNKKCKGCINSNCSPFGKKCWIANYIEIGGKKEYDKFKNQLVDEINSLEIEGLPKITELYELNGSTINLDFRLPNDKIVKLFNDDELYLGNQVDSEIDEDEKKSFGILANMNFILVCEYGNPSEIIMFKRR